MGTPCVPTRRTCALALFLIGCAAAFACGAPPEEILHCRDLLPEGQVNFVDLTTMLGRSGGKGCAGCHNTTSPVHGYNFEGPGVAYDALSNKPEIIYAQLASTAMPQSGQPWNEADLRIFRTWYCNGAVYED